MTIDYGMFMKDALVEEMKLTSAIEHRCIYLSEDVDDDIIFKIDYFISRIIRMDEEDGLSPSQTKPIKIIVNSYGGSIYDGLGLISRIEYLQEQGYEFHSEISSYSMSMGSAVSQICKHRTARRYATILYHTPISGLRGTLSDMDTQMKETQRLWELMKSISLKHTRMTPEYLESMFHSNKDFYMTPEQALELGVIDEIL